MLDVTDTSAKNPQPSGGRWAGEHYTHQRRVLLVQTL